MHYEYTPQHWQNWKSVLKTDNLLNSSEENSKTQGRENEFEEKF